MAIPLSFGTTPLDLTFGRGGTASSQTNQQTAPTSAQYRYSPQQLQTFNTALMDLLSNFNKKASTSKMGERMDAYQSEASKRVQASVPGQQYLSPEQQFRMRNADVGALEGGSDVLYKEFKQQESRIKNAPNLLKAVSQFASAFEDKSDEYVSTSFQKDDRGNVTFVGVKKNGEVVKKEVGKVGTTTKGPAPTFNDQISDFESILRGKVGPGGYVDINVYREQRGRAKDRAGFDSQFATTYLSPEDRQEFDYNAPTKAQSEDEVPELSFTLPELTQDVNLANGGKVERPLDIITSFKRNQRGTFEVLLDEARMQGVEIEDAINQIIAFYEYRMEMGIDRAVVEQIAREVYAADSAEGDGGEPWWALSDVFGPLK